jgi:hypothetical protein
MPSNGTEFIPSFPKIRHVFKKRTEMKGHTETNTDGKVASKGHISVLRRRVGY